MSKTDIFAQLIKANGINPKTIFDIGAFDCAETLSLGRAFPQAEIYAFECVPRLLAQCDAAIRYNSKLHLIPVALGGATTMIEFHESTGGNLECGSILEPNNQYYEPMPYRKIQVPMFKACDIINQLHIVPPEVIWMDVQGLEIDVLSGLAEHLRHIQMFWTEVTYKPYYKGQRCVAEYDHTFGMWGFEKIHEEVGIKEWFGNACYRRKSV